MISIETYLQEKAEVVNSKLDLYLNIQGNAPPSIVEAMRYAIFAGGKRLRPILAITVCHALGGKEEDILPAACSLELIHTYSLIHDDLPSMDDDDFRRGRPSTHKAFGEAIAILAGDALLTLAFEVLSRYPEKRETADGPKSGDETGDMLRKKLEIIETISSACGTAGLIGGQVQDLQSEGKKIGLSEFENLHLMKTGALIEASLISGAIMAGASVEKKELMASFGRKIGFVYQIADDLLDAEGSREIIGKETRKDQKKKKATFPSVYGIEESRQIARNLIKEAKNSIQSLGDDGKILSSLADFIIERTR